MHAGPLHGDILSAPLEADARLDDGEGLDDDERALSSLRAGRHESWLAYRLTTALRVAQLHTMDNVAVEEAAQALAEVLDDYLLRNGRVSLILDKECVYLNGRLVRTGSGGNAWLQDFSQLLSRRGIGGLLFAGAWAPAAARGLIQAFKTGGGSSAAERARAVAQACVTLVVEPAKITILDELQAREHVREAEEASLTPTEQAAFYYARLLALAEVAHQATGAGLSPDTYAREVRQTLRKVYEFLEHPVFERRILALTLRPPGDMPLGGHAAAVCVLSLCMGRLLGLKRGELSDLGFAALFHDLGRSLRARRAAPGGGEDLEQARAHPLDGVAFALRGHAYGHSELLRLIVAQEHHRLADGYPEAKFLRQPHPYARLIAVADAFHKLQSGTPWSRPVGQAKAITLLRDAPKQHDPGAVELLVDVLGRCPRGTILRLSDGGTVVSLDGAPRRGSLPVVRQITLPDRTLDTSDHVYPLRDFKQIRAEVDPSGVSLDEWSALCGKGIPCEARSDPSGEGALVSGSGELLEDERDPAEDAREVKVLIELIEKAVRLFRLYPSDHPFCAQAVDQLDQELRRYLDWRGVLTLELRRDGVHLGERLVMPDSGSASSLSYLLYPDGVRTLRFERGLDRKQILDFVATLARADGDTRLDLMDALWQREFNHIDHVAYDQLAPGAVERLNDPMLNPVAKRLLAILPDCQQLARRLSAELAAHAGWIGGEGQPTAGADPAQAAAFLETPAGQKRKALLDQLHDPFLGDVQGRATDIVAWAAADEDDPPPSADVSRFLAGTVGAALWRGDLGRAADMLSTGATMGCLDAVCRRLARKHPLELWARALEGQTDQALRYVSFFPDRCLPALAKLYGNLVGNDLGRQVLRSYFATRLDAAAEALGPLTLHADQKVAEEVMELLGQGEPGSPTHALLEAFAADSEHRGRAERARRALDSASGEGERQTSLRALSEGGSKTERLVAARRLRELHDVEAFDALRAVVQSREFLSREEDEIEEILGTLSALGGLRAVSVLQELSQRRGLLNRKGTVRISRAASSALKAMRETVGAREASQGARKGVPCPRCKFENTPRATKCLSCGAGLGADAASDHSTTRRHARPAVVPDLTDEVFAPPLQDVVVPSLGDEVRPARPRDDQQTVRLRGGAERLRAEHEPLPAPRAVFSQDDADAAVLWLRCHPFDPIPVGHKPVVEIGRGTQCDLVLAHGSVSRVHAVVRLVGGTAVIEDRSSYGTYVNGSRVATQQLAAGDTLTIGPYDIEVFDHDTAAPSEEEGTRPLRTFASSEAIGGRLERISLAEVLQQIEFNEKTGTLEVYGDGMEGVFVVYEGKPIYASLGSYRDAAAVVQMLRLQKGTFSFAAKVEAGEMTMAGQTITGLLMDASRQLDEEQLRRD